MSNSVLYLSLIPLRPGELLAYTPTRVYFAISSTLQDAPTTFDPDNRCWELRQSGLDFRKTNELFNQLQDARIAGKTLLEFIRYNGVSMWQFLPSWLWPAFFRVVEFIDILNQIVDDVAPQELRVFPVSDYTDPLWQGTVQAIGEAHGIPVSIVQTPLAKQLVVPELWPDLRQRLRTWLNQTAGGRAVLRLYRLARQPDRVVAGVLSSLSPLTHDGIKRQEGEVASDSPTGRKALCATLGKRHWVDVPGAPGRKYDEQFYPLLPALRAAGWTRFVMVDCQDSPEIELAQRARNGEAGVRWRRYASYRNQDDATLAEARALFAQMWQVLQDDPEFEQDFRYRGVRLMPALWQELQRAFHDLLPECAHLLAAASRMLAEERPDAVIATYEDGPWARALVIQAKRAKIPTLGLQHGMIFDNHYSYMHHRITTDPVTNPIGFVVPDITVVWGPFWKEILTKEGRYPPEAVVVTGNWRYDRILDLAIEADTAKIRRRFGIAPEKKVVLILSASQSYLDYIDQCLQVLVMQPECTPLIKLHPDDNPGPVYPMLRQHGYPDKLLVQGQLIEALMVADLVISQWSTVVSEVVLLERPVVLVNCQNITGAEAYVEAGTCLYVTKPEELAIAIKKGLYDASVRAQISAARTEFISRYFFKTDGCAAQRVAAALEARLPACDRALHDDPETPRGIMATVENPPP